MSKILNREITVERFKIVPSKFEGLRLDLQIKYKDETHVTWSQSPYLMDMVKKVPDDGFPFITTIIKVGERYEFS